MITLSEDGYVRLSYANLQDTPLIHLLSGLDEENLDLNQLESNVCRISGYTEWVSTTTPVITIGWDWRLEVAYGHPRYVRDGPLRSNLMLTDTKQRDMGLYESARYVEKVVDSIAWEEETTKGISARYGYIT